MEEQPLRREHGGIIWGASGSPLGSICLGIIWTHLEGLRLRRHLGDIWRSDLRNRDTSKQKSKVAFTFQFYGAFLRVIN